MDDQNHVQRIILPETMVVGGVRIAIILRSSLYQPSLVSIITESIVAILGTIHHIKRVLSCQVFVIKRPVVSRLLVMS